MPSELINLVTENLTDVPGREGAEMCVKKLGRHRYMRSYATTVYGLKLPMCAALSY